MRTLFISSLSGVFSVLFAAGCTASSAAPDASQGAEAALTSSSGTIGFDGSTPAAEVTLGGRAAERGPASSGIERALREITSIGANQNVLFEAGVYQIDAAGLAAFAATGATQQDIAYDIMFRVDGSKAGGHDGFGFQVKLESTESLDCGAIHSDAALSTFEDARAFDAVHADDSIDAAQRQSVEKDAALVVGALLKSSPSSKVVKCVWSNNDDTDATALITVDDGTGVVRVLLAWAGG
jgi:hypothetical protein